MQSHLSILPTDEMLPCTELHGIFRPYDSHTNALITYAIHTSCRRAAAMICLRPYPHPVGAETPRAAEQTAT